MSRIYDATRCRFISTVVKTNSRENFKKGDFFIGKETYVYL
jgi:hypothetical protein